MKNQNRILVVDDEASIRHILRTYLESAGFEVQCIDNGPDALTWNRREKPDLIVLDLNLPGMDGIEVAARIREESDVYILMLTARGEEDDKIAGLRLGADDYLTKPFSPRELVARVQTVLRRQRDSKPVLSRQLVFEHLTIDPDSFEAFASGSKLSLTVTEFQVLWLLASNAGRVLTRTQLLDQVWGAEFYGNERVVDVYVGQVRRKLQEASGEPLVETIRGIGYKFVDQKAA